MSVSSSYRVASGKNNFRSLSGSRQGHSGAGGGGGVFLVWNGISGGFDDSTILQPTIASRRTRMPAQKMRCLDISVTDAGGCDYHIIAIGQDFPGDGHTAFERNAHDDEACGFRVHLDDACLVAQTEPATGYRTFFNHRTTHGHMWRCGASPDGENRMRLTVRWFAENRSLRLMTTDCQQGTNQKKEGGAHNPNHQGTGPIPGAEGGKQC